MRVTAIILAAGSGSRMSTSVTKQQLNICGESILSRSVRAFEAAPSVDAIVIVRRRGELDFAVTATSGIKKLKGITVGGDTRAESARIGFELAEPFSDYVAIHDAARCLITPEMIEKVIADAALHGAATASSAVTDTVKRVDEEGAILETVSRAELRSVQTPQVFKTELYRYALTKSEGCGADITDDNMLLENAGIAVFCTDTGKENIKITSPDDILYAEYIIKRGESR